MLNSRCFVLLVTGTLALHVLGGVRCPNVAFVVHSNNNNDHVTDFMANTFLLDTNLVVMTGHDSFDATVNSRRLNLRRVIYDGNPGGIEKTFTTGGRKYLGTHRTMAGILIAMDTLPHVDWVYVLDDDNVVNVDVLCETLGKVDPEVPLLLGYVGPKHDRAPCRPTSSDTQWTCCTNIKKPCLVNSSSPYRSSSFVYNKTLQTMIPKDCRTQGADCCEVVPWPEGITHGYPFRKRRKSDTNDELASTLNSVGLWPYGGGTYAISKAMLRAVGRHNWERNMYRLQCANADINVMTTIFNAGYSIHQWDHVFTGSFAPHHVHTIKEQFNAFSVTHQPRVVLQAACSRHNMTELVGHETFHRVCKDISSPG